MVEEFLKFAAGVLISTGFVGAVAYFMRDLIGGWFTQAVEHRFEKKIETFKAGIRENEKELDQIRSFLVSARRDRDAIFESKRLEAAEALLRARHALSQLSILAEYMKILDTDKILKNSGDPKIAELFDTLAKPFDVDEKIRFIGSIDKTGPRLYLSERSLKYFDAYESIILKAAMMIKMLSVPLRDMDKFLQGSDVLRKMIEELAPNSKGGFEKFGERYAYYWLSYFHDEILRALRHEVSGTEDMSRDAESVKHLLLNSRRAQIDIRASLERAGLRENLILSQEDVAANSSAAEKAAK